MIRLVCSCGKKLSAPAHLAGKAVKCPQCGTRLNVPPPQAPPDPPAPASPSDDPFAFDTGELSATKKTILSVRRLIRTWRDTVGQEAEKIHEVQPIVVKMLPAKMKSFGTPEAVFDGKPSPGMGDTLGLLLCGPIILGALLTGGLVLGIEELRDKFLLAGLLALGVALVAVGVWVLLAQFGKAKPPGFALLYSDGFAVVDGKKGSFYRWDQIAEVEISPETQNLGNLVLFGHQFRVKTHQDEQIRLNMDYFGVVELGLAIMERSAPHGAECTGKIRLPK